jgi:glycosyltransferase involved in cell wall biosynthesis
VKHVVFAHRKLSFGGGERVLIEQVAALAGLPVRVSVIFRKEPDKRDIEPELRRRNPRLEDVSHVPGFMGSYRWLKSRKPDLLVLCNHKGAMRALPWLARTGTRIPTVVTLHEHYERHLRKYRGIRDLVDRWIVTWAFEQAVREHLGAQPCSRIHPLYPRPVPPSVYEEDRRNARKLLGLPEDALVVGYVGQIDERKDPVATLALAEALQRHVQVPLHLLLAGRVESSCKEGLERAIRHSPLASRTILTGPLPDIAPAFTCLDLYLMTSHNEGFFPLALVEALERGVPLMVPPVGGVSTVLQEGEGGFLIPKEDDREAIPSASLEMAARRVAPLLMDPHGWSIQREKAVSLGARLTQGYDAAQLFREAVAEWL